MSTTKPMVSVVLPVYNAAPYLSEALESLLAQTFTDFEIIAVNDGSTDASAEVLQRYARRDGRLHVLEQENAGCGVTRNRALGEARGSYVMNMDADDISRPDRLALLVRRMDSQPAIGALGSSMACFGDGIRAYTWRPAYADHARIFASMLFGNYSLANATVIFRASALQALTPLYNPAFSCAEDYELFARFGAITRMANIPDVLYRRRFHAGCTSRAACDTMYGMACRVRAKLLQKLLQQITEEEFALHELSTRTETTGDRRQTLAEAEQWFLRLYHANETVKAYESPALREVIQHVWQRLVCSSYWQGDRPVRYLFATRGLCRLQGLRARAVYLARKVLQWRER